MSTGDGVDSWAEGTKLVRGGLSRSHFEETA